ncbi:MAG: hypothetical protein K8S55_15525 [Phycisphaerae bacterium]|nr:hypothetical protein [Phycisphaerae bacterium]
MINKPLSIVWDLLFCFAFIVLFSKIFLYLTGFANAGPLAGGAFFWLAALVVGPIAVIWRTVKKQHLKMRIARISLCVFTIVCCVILRLSIPATGAELYCEGFRDGIMPKVDVEAIRTWHKEIPRPLKDEGLSVKFISRSEWPDFIEKLSPARVYCSEEQVTLSWGMGFNDPWGIYIGSQTTYVPETGWDALILPVRPGVYVFFRGE